METTKSTKIWKKEEENLHHAISSLRKCMIDYKADRKSEWKSFKNKFNEDLEKAEKSFVKLAALHVNKVN